MRKPRWSFAPQHLSCYHLTLEPNTLFHNKPAVAAGRRCEQRHAAEHEELLAAARLPALRDFRVRATEVPFKHNLNYWQFGDYLGIGAGRSSKLSFPER